MRWGLIPGWWDRLAALAIMLAALPVPAAAWHAEGEFGAEGHLQVCPGIFKNLPQDVEENPFACPLGPESRDEAKEVHTALDTQVLLFWHGCAARAIDQMACIEEYKRARQKQDAGDTVIGESLILNLLSRGAYCRDERAKHHPLPLSCMTDKELIKAGTSRKKVDDAIDADERNRRRKLLTPCAALPKGAVRNGDRFMNCDMQVTAPTSDTGEKY